MLINRQNLSNLFTGYKAAFQAAFDGAPVDYDKVAMEVPSTTSQEQYAWLGQTTQFREWVGDRFIQNARTYDYTIKNRTFENTVSVEREAIEDDSYGVYAPLMSQLGMDARQHPGLLVWDLVKNGFTQTGYDGQYFFDTDHPVLDANGAVTSVSNHGGGAGTAWYLFDTSRVVKPIILQRRKDYNFVSLDRETDENVFMRKQYVYGTDARLNAGYGLWQLAYGSKQTLDAAGFGAAFAAMSSLKGDNAKPLGVRPTLLVVPPTLRDAALTVVSAQINAAGATNINANAVDVLVTPWLA
jgi:phage major head subunit gpT-like protein